MGFPINMIVQEAEFADIKTIFVNHYKTILQNVVKDINKCISHSNVESSDYDKFNYLMQNGTFKCKYMDD